MSAIPFLNALSNPNLIWRIEALNRVVSPGEALLQLSNPSQHSVLEAAKHIIKARNQHARRQAYEDLMECCWQALNISEPCPSVEDFATRIVGMMETRDPALPLPDDRAAQLAAAELFLSALHSLVKPERAPRFMHLSNHSELTRQAREHKARPTYAPLDRDLLESCLLDAGYKIWIAPEQREKYASQWNAIKDGPHASPALIENFQVALDAAKQAYIEAGKRLTVPERHALPLPPLMVAESYYKTAILTGSWDDAKNFRRDVFGHESLPALLDLPPELLRVPVHRSQAWRDFQHDQPDDANRLIAAAGEWIHHSWKFSGNPEGRRVDPHAASERYYAVILEALGHEPAAPVINPGKPIFAVLHQHMPDLFDDQGSIQPGKAEEAIIAVLAFSRDPQAKRAGEATDERHHPNRTTFRALLAAAIFPATEAARLEAIAYAPLHMAHQQLKVDHAPARRGRM